MTEANSLYLHMRLYVEEWVAAEKSYNALLNRVHQGERTEEIRNAIQMHFDNCHRKFHQVDQFLKRYPMTTCLGVISSGICSCGQHPEPEAQYQRLWAENQALKGEMERYRGLWLDSIQIKTKNPSQGGA